MRRHVDFMFCVAPISFFRGKTIIVADCANDIGSETARTFAELGANVTIAGRNAGAIKKTKELCVEAGANDGNILEIVADSVSEETPKIIVDETINAFGAIDVLVIKTNEADSVVKRSIESISSEEIDNINLRFILEMINLCAPHLEKTKGAIVNVSSITAISFEQQDMFNAISRTPIDMLIVQSSAQLITKGIRVNSVNYGLAEAGIERKKCLPNNRERDLRFLGRNMCMIPLAGYPADIANLIIFLSDGSQAKNVVGQRFVVD